MRIHYRFVLYIKIVKIKSLRIFKFYTGFPYMLTIIKILNFPFIEKYMNDQVIVTLS